MAPHGTFYWNELMTRDVEAARTFYADALGWQFDAMPMGEEGTYWVVMVDGKPAGGMMQMAGPAFEGVPDHWMAYIAVDDIDKRLAAAKAAGASAIREPFDVPGVGRIAIVREPGGAAIGWMTAADPS